MFSVVGGAWGLATLDALELKVIHHRQPMFVILSDGSVQNRYQLKILNKTDQQIDAAITVSGPEGLTMVGASQAITLTPSGMTSREVFIRIPAKILDENTSQILFNVTTSSDQLKSSRAAVFVSPGKGRQE